MVNECVGGDIVSKGSFYEQALYDVSNMKMTAGFDGRGALHSYAVINKWSYLSAFYNTIILGNRVIDFMLPKTVVMKGREQIVRFENDEADVSIHTFTANQTNAVFWEYTVHAKKDTVFQSTFNIELDFKSYLSTLFIARFSMKNLCRFIKGLFRLAVKGGACTEEDGNILTVRNDPWGECYVDFAMEKPAAALEKQGVYFNQYALSREVKRGETAVIRMVLSMGTRSKKDFSREDARECLARFDEYKKEAGEYTASLVCPPSCDTETKKALYRSAYNCALSMYKEAGKFKGFMAGLVYQSPARTYYRDGYWTALAVLNEKPELVRNQIITLAYGVAKDGTCPSAVRYNFKKWWGGHYDSPSFFAILLFDYVRISGDRSVLSENINGATLMETAERVIAKLTEKTDETGLIYKAGPYNRLDWCDNVFRHGYVTYDEALYARALYSLSRLFEECDKEKSNLYHGKYQKVKNAINNLLWLPEKGYYVNYIDGNDIEDNLSIDTALCVLFGIAEGERAERLIDNMERMLESRNNKEQGAGDFGVLSVYPFYKSGKACVGKSSYPYYYHNGGDWPYLSCAYAYAKLMQKRDYSYPLTRWFEYNLQCGNFTPVEFFSPLHPRGSLLQGWSGLAAWVLSYPDGNFFRG